ncbi:MAG: hypothetical protein JNM43_16955 [Planctomycetaceae bacterium]|nr:hypothetical protein [Planctomycetaceae bacterium]
MNSETPGDSDSADGRFRELLGIADRHTFEPGAGLLDRVKNSLSEAIDACETIDGPATCLKPWTGSGESKAVAQSFVPATFGRLRIWTLACAAAACLAVSMMTFLRSPEALGDVLSALRLQPRVHIRCQDVRGHDLEAWISADRYSVKRTESSFIFDRVKKSVDTYYPAKERILRSVPSFQHEPPAFDSLLKLLESLPGTVNDIGGMQVVSMRSRPEGASTVRHSIELTSPPSHLNGTITMSLSVVAEASTSLPTACTVTIRQSGHNDPVDRTLSLLFDYPDEEPLSIQELGASAAATLVDTTKPESDPLYARVQAALEHGRRGLKKYRALAGTDPDVPQYVIWRSGRQWRVDDLGNFRGQRISGDPGQTPPVVDLTHWSDQFSGGGHTQMLFDGTDRWDRNEERLVKAVLPPFFPQQLRESQWIGSMTLERLAYPFLGVEDGFVMTVSEESPGGLVLIEYSAAVKTDDLTHRTKRYWLNPEYGYAVVKSEFTDATGSEEMFRATMGSRKHMVHLNSGYKQSPDGIWYPGAVRDVGKQFFQTRDNPVLIDDWMYYKVDFSTSIPEDTFSAP